MKRTVRIVILIVASSLSVWLFFINTTSITESQTVFLGQSDDYSPQDLTVKMPDPGTYTLHKIFSVPELTVLDSTGTLQPISKYTKGKITLLVKKKKNTITITHPYIQPHLYITYQKIASNDIGGLRLEN
jgi:hypothetical protein